ncbi:MAG TPA: ABC transporter permease [Ferruginibacter sp.]|nr:ABC transporter permease [Ferruginibacter sp.]
MLKNYLKVAWRNLLRYKGFSLINIASLAIGVTGCLIIALFIRDELMYDRFIKNGDEVYRVYTKRTDHQGSTHMASVPPMYASYLRQQYPEVENTLRIMMASGNILIEAGKTKSYEEKWMITEPSFFHFYPLPFLHGNPATALTGVNSVVITEAFAKKYFGKTDVIDKIIRMDKDEFAVKGVLATLPEHFHLDFDFLFPITALKLPADRMNSWRWNQFFTYIKVKPGSNIGQLQAKFFTASKKEVSTLPDRSDDIYEPFFQPLKDIHLGSADFRYDNAKRGNKSYVRGLTIIALFVLVIAGFNFINLATARSFRRAKEIGVRKVVGAERTQLLFQFTTESVLLSVIAVLIATIATFLLVPSLNNFTGKHISFNPVTNPLLGILLIGAAILIGMLAGIYPAMVMSGFKVIRVIKGLKPGSDSGHASWMRQGLVIVQFALSAILIISSVIVYKQLNYLHDKNLGFNKEQVVFFPLRGGIDKKSDAFKQEILKIPNVVSSTIGYGLPGDLYAGDQVNIPGKADKPMSTTLFIGDADYISTLGLQIVAGRDFSKDMPTDAEEAFIINEAAVKEFGFESPQKALGQRLSWPKWIPDSVHPIKEGRVIGVVKDFHYTSLHEKVGNLVLEQYAPIKDKMAIKLKTSDISGSIASIKKVWDKFSPAYPLEYKFLDESFGKMYKSEDKLAGLLSIFTAMAIFVGCMGLFGLATFTTEQRTKEIGIRKVLGATVLGIIIMLSRKFLQPVFIASIIAFPVAWWAMNKWLEDFAYRVQISWWIFIIAAIAALAIAWITVSFQAIKAALANPVKSLRTE